MIATTFKSGNYDYWQKLLTVTIPEALSTVRNTIIPDIDKLLVSMLSNTAVIEKTSIDIEPNISRSSNVTLEGLTCKIVYKVEDFKCPEAPEKAIEEDTSSIKGYLERDGETNVRLSDVTIDTTEGSLTLIYNIVL